MRIVRIGKTKENNLWYCNGRWIMDDRDEEIHTSQFKLVSPAGLLVAIAKPEGNIELSFGSKYLIERVLDMSKKGNGYTVNLNGRRTVITKEEILLDIQGIIGWKGFRFSTKASEYWSDDLLAWEAFISGRIADGSGNGGDSIGMSPAGRSLLNC